jgi:5-methylcytosine-specific restriction protein A
MPVAPPKPCTSPGCGAFALANGRCAAHNRQAERRRGTSTERGYDATWRRLRLIVLAEEPLCRRCLERGLIVASREVDHIIPIGRRPDLRVVRSNLRGLCKPCHSAITAEQVGWTTKSRVHR